MVRPGIPHAVVDGTGPIEHFVLQIPAPQDRQTVARMPAELPAVAGESERELKAEWGCRVPLTDVKNQNCWLFGARPSPFYSDQMCLAYLSFPDAEAASSDGHSHRLHLHQESWEYYCVLRGTKVLRVEEELVRISAGEILAVPPQVKHMLHAREETPFEGITFRVPRLNDKIEF